MSTREDTPVVHEPDDAFVEETNIWAFMQEYGIEDYDTLIERTTTAVDGVEESGLDWFWDELVDYLGIEFYTPYDQIRDTSDGPQFTDWYQGGELNIAHNVLDRHVEDDTATRNRTALVWEGEDGSVREVSYQRFYHEANQVANFLEAEGVTAGDTVALYMPMVPEVVSILYGIFKVGAVAVPIFSGFGVDAAATRLEDAEPAVLFTGDGFYRRGDPIRLKGAADDAIEAAGHVDRTVVVDRLGEVEAGTVPWDDKRDQSWEDAIATQPRTYETTPVAADHPAMLLYSSGTTGMPKGIVQTHAGAQMQCAKEVYFGFDLKPADRFFWVADIGWMMGPWTLIGTHTFGASVVMYEGAPDHPDPGRYWDIIERHRVTQFGISPTAIRALKEHGSEWVDEYDLSSLRLLLRRNRNLWVLPHADADSITQAGHTRWPRPGDGHRHRRPGGQLDRRHDRPGIPGRAVLVSVDDQVAVEWGRTVPQRVLVDVAGSVGPRRLGPARCGRTVVPPRTGRRDPQCRWSESRSGRD